MNNTIPQPPASGPTWPDLIEWEWLSDSLDSETMRRVALLELALIDRKIRRSLRRKLRQGQRDFARVGDPVWIRAEAAFNEQLSGGR